MNKILAETISGKVIDLEKFSKDDIVIDDIAVSLSRQRRYAGHTIVPWSVAQHSLFCSTLADAGGADKNNIKACFLHDVEEAYVKDIINPIKSSFMYKKYDKCCDNISSIVFDHFGCSGFDPRFIKMIDMVAYCFEHVAFRPHSLNPPNVSEEVYEKFLWYKDTLKIGIPQELILMTEEEQIETMGQFLTVFTAEETIGQEISSEVTPDEIKEVFETGD